VFFPYIIKIAILTIITIFDFIGKFVKMDSSDCKKDKCKCCIDN